MKFLGSMIIFGVLVAWITSAAMGHFDTLHAEAQDQHQERLP